MKKVIVFVLIVIISFFCSTIETFATPTEILLGTGENTTCGNIRGDYLDSGFIVKVGYDLSYPVEIWLKWNVTSADMDNTLFASTGFENFDEVTSYLTNGIIETFMCGQESFGAGASGCREDIFFQKIPFFEGPDFEGGTITKLGAKMHNLTVLDPDANLYKFDVTVTVFGTPEPSSLLLLGLGAVMLRKKR